MRPQKSAALVGKGARVYAPRRGTCTHRRAHHLLNPHEPTCTRAYVCAYIPDARAHITVHLHRQGGTGALDGALYEATERVMGCAERGCCPHAGGATGAF
eukprot:6835432-Pyramimonas_sp.AAC.1